MPIRMLQVARFPSPNAIVMRKKKREQAYQSKSAAPDTTPIILISDKYSFFQMEKSLAPASATMDLPTAVPM